MPLSSTIQAPKIIDAEEIAVLITPQIAKEWLSLNGLNRPLDRRLVSLYSSVMTRGAWQLTGETIVFGDNGRLLDGQHRLAAIVDSGVATRIAVIGKVPNPDKVFHSMGSGKPRSNPDILAIAGEANASDLSSTVRAYCQYHYGVTKKQATLKVPPDIMFSILNRHPGLRSWCAAAARLKKRGFSQSIMAVILFGMEHYSSDKAQSFFENCESGACLASDDPAFILRERLVYRSRTENIPRNIVYAMCIKAANAHLSGKRISRLTWLSEREAFPDIIGYPPDLSEVR